MSIPRAALYGPLYVMAAMLAWSGAALADTVWLGNLKLEVRITGFRNGEELLFDTAAGVSSSRNIAQITRIEVTDQKLLNEAEEAFARKDMDRATELYQKARNAISPTDRTRAWIRDWCAARMAKTSAAATRFDLVIRAFVDVARKSPEQAENMTQKLTMPPAGSKYLDDAAKILETAINDTRSDASIAVMLKVLQQVYTAAGRADEAQKASARRREALLRLNPNSPEAIAANIELKLKTARASLAARRYDEAEKAIREVAANIVEPAMQAEALFILAEAAAGKAEGSADAGVWKDVAIGYMRVAANAPASAPETARSLLKTAAILAGPLNDKPAAMNLYRQIAADYKGQPAAAEAEKELARLEKELPRGK